ncbi:MAG: CusA/CzcA family heavy metal efflux RND transporter [Bacteroidetes bacterium]|nr:MAG: CusA/CzcA family heavy metal efflux RND transporter [Bacteroidota bacterium]
MLDKIIQYSIHHKLIVFLFTAGIVGFGVFALLNIPIGAVPDVTNNQVQVITTTRNLSTQDVEQFITYPVELEMANLPGVKEIRSVSKFGLSVVTIVFEDDMGTYLPRQLISEKIKAAEEKIPEGFGRPFMGPVSTGLGEIYQYILDVKPGYEGKYSTMDLRTIQDWIVKRQLSGIPGVVEVNTWGGKLKQYEVSINPERLRTLGVSVIEVYEALQRNNSVAGGGYIEKTNESYFVRGEGLVGSLEDIEKTVVKKVNGVPLFVKDVATVRFGFANRFGAITANGEGEKVLGQVMMLKGANSKAVIERVKERVAEVQKTLPEGVYINPFLERSELIAKTTGTITENLVLGCLIVIFVVVLLLGNFRSGFVVASVIPLSLLFALSLMYIFNVDANLMSLGAIDFGIIIDGAVIIVEFVAFQITGQKNTLEALPADERQHFINNLTAKSASRMMHSAIFGQLIIIIVFIPILSLSEVEGKMFRPMAMTFCFALIGAMLLCLTYVPALSSLVLKPSAVGKKNLSARLMAFLGRIYTPSLNAVLKFKGVVLTLAVLLLVGVGGVFSNMGGEFVPTLDEGDFVIQPVLKTGTTLTKTIETMTQMEKIVKTFPEVRQVVTRIGAAEVPTDPMSMEETDMIITLRPPSEWTTAKTKDDLADSLKAALSVLPGLDYEFTQPIEMRFNELITGVRADLAIKVFGEDLDILNRTAQKIKDAIEGVPGAADISVEKTAGLPQMSVKYLRPQIARYGLNIETVNNILTMTFAGLPAGSVFEGEKQFDLVVRYDARFRKDLEDLKSIPVPLPDGGQIPLSELADIEYSKGPAKISRDDTHRRIVVGVNVRNRDLESVVEDIRRIIDKEITLPPGYYITYGGQFKNLQNARARLLMAVPVALFLIFILLYFAFQSAKEALMVYSAVPLAAVGGILALWFRDMPFSISAGVGFIALFGIAVLNGIVMIERFKELKAEGMTNLNKRILVGAQQRLRPVLLTALAAALGFLPMAVSTSAGAEVQRPLATVVVGGLISATLLTLLVLPVLYAIFDRKILNRQGGKGFVSVLLPFLFCFLAALPSRSQNVLSLDEIIDLALKNNAALKHSALEIESGKWLEKAARLNEKTHVYFNFDQNNIAENGDPLSVVGLYQNFKMPGYYKAEKALRQNETRVHAEALKMEEWRLRKSVSEAFYTIRYQENLRANYEMLDSLYGAFARAAERRFDTGETNYLEKLTAETRKKEFALQLEQCDAQIEAAYARLFGLVQSAEPFQIEPDTLRRLRLTEPDFENHPSKNWFEAAAAAAQSRVQWTEKQMLPEIQAEYFLGTNAGTNAKIYQGFQVGVGVPLWRKAGQSQIHAAEIEPLKIEALARDYQQKLNGTYQSLKARLDRLEKGLRFYETDGRRLAAEIVKTASRAYQTGEIDFMQYLLSLERSNEIEKNYLDNLFQYNLTVLEIIYLTN